MCVCVCVRQMSARAQIWRGGRLREGVGVGVGGQGCCHRHGNMLSHDVPSRSGEGQGRRSIERAQCKEDNMPQRNGVQMEGWRERGSWRGCEGRCGGDWGGGGWMKM